MYGPEERRGAALCVALLMVSLAPTALGAAASGKFVVGGALDLPGGASATFRPHAILLNDSSEVDAITFTGQRIRVCEGWREDVEIASGDYRVFKDLRGGIECFALTEAGGSLAPSADNAGWVGIYGREEATATLEATGRMVTVPATVKTLASPDANGVSTTTEPENPKRAYFTARVTDPSAHLTAPGTLTYQGPGILVLKGPDVRITARENVTDYATFDRPTSESVARQRALRWLWVESDALHVRITTSQTAIEAVAHREHSAGWDGDAILTNASGTLHGDAADYTAEDEPVALEGRFSADLIVNVGGDAFSVRLDGDMRGASIPALGTIAPAPAGGWSWPGVFAVGVVCGGVAALGSWYYLREARTQKLLRGFRRSAERAEAEFEYQRALTQVLAARRLAPLDFELAIWEASLRKNLGEWDDALDSYDEAVKLAPGGDGSAQYWAAVTLLHRGAQGDTEAALGYVMGALTHDPGLAFEIEGDELFAPLKPHGLPRLLDEAKAKARWFRGWR